MIRTYLGIGLLGAGVGICAGALLQHPEPRITFHEQPNGDYRLAIAGGRSLVCEEQDVRVLSQPTDITPLVLECKHSADPEYAEGEWKIDIQLQPCANNQIEPIWDPKNPAVLTVECNHMPVEVK